MITDDTNNEEIVGGRRAFLFAAGEWHAVTLDQTGANLPPVGGRPWVLQRSFVLGIRDVGLLDKAPEPIICEIWARGYYLWRPDDARMAANTN